MQTTMQATKLMPVQQLPGIPGATVGDFWSWAYSDILTNTTRAVYAEFLVASALGIAGTIRREWGSFDLLYGDQHVEVKAAGYIQSWAPPVAQAKVRFDVAKHYPWDPDTNRLGDVRVRSAHCYVFCVYTDTNRDRAFATVLDASFWDFYVVATPDIERHIPNNKTISLAALRSIFGVSGIAFDQLRPAVDGALGLVSAFT